MNPTQKRKRQDSSTTTTITFKNNKQQKTQEEEEEEYNNNDNLTQEIDSYRDDEDDIPFDQKEEEVYWTDPKAPSRTFWKAQVAAYGVPICRKPGLRVSCPSSKCNFATMYPFYIDCKGKNGSFASMVYNCALCESYCDTKDEMRATSIFSSKSPRTFFINYVKRARACGIEPTKLSEIPNPDDTAESLILLGGGGGGGNDGRGGSHNTPTPILEDIYKRLDKIEENLSRLNNNNNSKPLPEIEIEEEEITTTENQPLDSSSS